MKRTGQAACQERVCQVSGSRAVDRKGCQYSEMTSAIRIKRKWHHQRMKSTERHVREEKTSRLQTNNQQQERLPRFRDVRSKPDQEKVEASDKDAEKKRCQSRKGFKS